MKKRNYIKSMRQTLSASNASKQPKHSLIVHIPRDVLRYNLSPYFQSFEKFKLRMVCSEFNDMYKDSTHILLSSIESDLRYWTTHSLSKYYKISPNYFSQIDLRHNRLTYMTNEEQIALKYFVIHNRNIESLLIDNVTLKKSTVNDDTKEEESVSETTNSEKERNVLMTRKENMIEMTRISFSNSSTESLSENITWIGDVLRFYSSSTSPLDRVCNIHCLKILDLNYIGLTDEYLLTLCQALLARKTALNELEYLLLLNNINITDKYVHILFEALEKSCPNLSHLNLRRCNLSDAACSVVLNYYLRNHEITAITHLDLELNAKISKIGTDKIHKIFQINNKKLLKQLVIHYGANKKSYCWECRTLYDQ